MKKVLIVLSILLAVLGTSGTGYFYWQYSTTKGEKEILVTQNGQLQNAIDAIGPVTKAWTVKTTVFAGKEIKEDDLVEQTIPVSSVNENYILEKSDLLGKYYKVSTQPGTSLTKDIVMDDEMPATTYERDLTFSFLPLGLKLGDYIDIRMVLPYGEEFIVIEHERVEQIVTSTNTVKVLLDEAQLALWTSARTDKALWGNKGLALYVTKYVEPGIHDPAIPFYPVRKEMESVVTLNPNIANKKQCVNAELRNEIERKLAAVNDTDGGVINSGRLEEATGINTSKEMYSPGATGNPETSGSGGSSKGGTVNKSDPTIQDEINNLNNIGDSMLLDPVDSSGNTSSVTNNDRIKSEGEDMFSDEDIIQ